MAPTFDPEDPGSSPDGVFVVVELSSTKQVENNENYDDYHVSI